MPSSMQKETWKETWNIPYKRRRFIIGTVIMLSLVAYMPIFFKNIEKRKGVLLNDFVLSAITPHNVSVLIFAVIWGMVALTIVRAVKNSSIYITYCWTLISVTLLRFLAITLVPLDPPVGLIPLTDPLTGIFYGQALIVKDLFFSGHTATLTLMFLCLERRNDKIIGLLAVVVVAFLLLVQHIHYTIDILASPIITYTCYRVTKHFLFKKDNALVKAQSDSVSV